jgi:hypothetical protein
VIFGLFQRRIIDAPQPVVAAQARSQRFWLVAKVPTRQSAAIQTEKVLAFIAPHNRLMRAHGARCIVTIRNAQRASVQDRR